MHHIFSWHLPPHSYSHNFPLEEILFFSMVFIDTSPYHFLGTITDQHCRCSNESWFDEFFNEKNSVKEKFDSVYPSDSGWFISNSPPFSFLSQIITSLWADTSPLHPEDSLVMMYDSPLQYHHHFRRILSPLLTEGLFSHDDWSVQTPFVATLGGYFSVAPED